MANRDTKLNIIVDAQNKATSGLRSVGKDLGGLEKQGGVLTGTFSALKVATAAAAAAIGAMGLNVIKAGARFEQTQIAFTTMLGSAEAAKKTLDELSTFASKTPFELEQLEEASKRLLAYGTTADDLIPTLKMLGDITAGVGMEKLPQLILAFGQVQAATKLTGAELRQFAEAGVPLLGVLADKFGTSEAAVIEMVSAGEVSFGDMKDALASLTAEGGKFFNLMENQSQSLGGMWSNLKDQISLTARVIGTELMPFVKPVVEDLIRMATTIREMVTAFGNLDMSIMAHSDMLLILRGYWVQIVDTFNQHLRPALDYLKSQFAGNSEELKIVLAFFGKLLAFIISEALIMGIRVLAAAIRSIGAAFEIIIPPIEAFIRMVGKAVDKMQELVEMAKGLGLAKKISSFFGGGRAAGGPVSAGTQYMVGEQGPEMFVPKTSGTIIPNNKVSTGAPVYINITGNTLLSEDVAEQLGDMMLSRLKLSSAL